MNFKTETAKSCFDSLANDFSHSTFKIRQALNFLVYNFYEFDNDSRKEFFLASEDNTGISEIVNRERERFLNEELFQTEKSYEKEPDTIDIFDNRRIIYDRHNLINYLPPSFFEIDFEFRDSGLFKDLSSGEKQMVFSINSLIYHLFNLQSIQSDTPEDRISYTYFNIVLDEIELYFHPEFQRRYLFELLRYLQVMNFIVDGVNILFLTHSPFILSDLPSSNILKLENGVVIENNNGTFGANIYDLLNDEFFLKQGVIGEFAKLKIQEVLDSLNSTERKLPKWISKPVEMKLFIKEIGEEVLRTKMLDMFFRAYPKEFDKQERDIERELLLKKLRELDDTN